MSKLVIMGTIEPSPGTRHTITVVPHWLYFMTLPDEGFRNSTLRGARPGQILSHITDGIPVNEEPENTRVADKARPPAPTQQQAILSLGVSVEPGLRAERGEWRQRK